MCDAVVLVLSATISTTSSKGIKWHSLVSGAFLGVAGVGISITLLLVAPTLQPASWAIGRYDGADVSASGVPNVAYMSLVAMIMGQGTMIGRLCSFHPHDTVQPAGHQTISMMLCMLLSTPAWSQACNEVVGCSDHMCAESHSEISAALLSQSWNWGVLRV